jgi:predicted ATPase
MEIGGLRGWTGHRIEFRFPIVAVVGPNGSGKSTILQAAAASYKSPGNEKKWKFPADFFPDTPWDTIKDAFINYQVREGNKSHQDTVKKLTERWRRQTERRSRRVHYIDLSRVQPLVARWGFLGLAKPTVREVKSEAIGDEALKRFSRIMNADYSAARFASTEVDDERFVPVVTKNGVAYSGFHKGAGELTCLELAQREFEKYSLVIIDEIESSLHPKMQRLLIRDLASLSRERDIQFIISTHSPTVLSEIPPEGRMLIIETEKGKATVSGVSPEFALSRMDEVSHYECDVFVEDYASEVFLREMMVMTDRDALSRVDIVTFGKASVGANLGIMVQEGRFHRPTVVFLDGDQGPSPGVNILPGGDAPEIVVFDALKEKSWIEIPDRLGRSRSEVVERLTGAMTLPNHHEWLEKAADPMFIDKAQLWQAMCAVWVKHCTNDQQREAVAEIIRKALPVN